MARPPSAPQGSQRARGLADCSCPGLPAPAEAVTSAGSLGELETPLLRPRSQVPSCAPPGDRGPGSPRTLAAGLQGALLPDSYTLALLPPRCWHWGQMPCRGQCLSDLSRGLNWHVHAAASPEANLARWKQDQVSSPQESWGSCDALRDLLPPHWPEFSHMTLLTAKELGKCSLQHRALRPTKLEGSSSGQTSSSQRHVHAVLFQQQLPHKPRRPAVSQETRDSCTSV